jgi:hypothetical protein
LECVATSLSTGYSYNDPVQKCFRLRRNLFESVWCCSLVLQLATVQWEKQRLPPPPPPHSLIPARTRLSLFRSLYQTKSISTNAQYVTVQKYFSHPSFSS